MLFVRWQEEAAEQEAARKLAAEEAAREPVGGEEVELDAATRQRAAEVDGGPLKRAPDTEAEREQAAEVEVVQGVEADKKAASEAAEARRAGFGDVSGGVAMGAGCGAGSGAGGIPILELPRFVHRASAGDAEDDCDLEEATSAPTLQQDVECSPSKVAHSVRSQLE